MAPEKETSEGQDDASPEVIIAVMGGTGTGKSSFIHLATGDSTIVIGEGLQSSKSAHSEDQISHGKILTRW